MNRGISTARGLVIRSVLRISAVMLFATVVCGVAPARADDTPPAERTVVIGPRYGAGFLRSWLWGEGYRSLYTSPVTLPVLDLRTEGGGLVPSDRLGGSETRTLALKGADGRDYTFRPVLKDAKQLLPLDVRETLAHRLLIDQLPAGLAFPGSSLTA